MSEPDYTLTITQESEGWVVYEGGEILSKPFADHASAASFAENHRRWRQPRCCVCGSAESRRDDPWDSLGADRYGPDWAHESCAREFVSWAEEEHKREKQEERKKAEALEKERQRNIALYRHPGLLDE